MTNKSESPLLVKAAQMQVERGLTNITEAVLILGREHPELYDEYRSNILMLSGPSESTRKAKEAETERDEFFVQATKLAHKRHIDDVEAAAILARENPILYSRYHANLVGLESPVSVKASEASFLTETADNSELLIQAKALADEDGITVVQASMRLAENSPELYDSYRNSLGRK